LKLTLATSADLDAVKSIFKPHRAIFPYLRNDYLKQAIDEGRCIYHQGIVIIYRNYKHHSWIGKQLVKKGDCVLLEIVKNSNSQTNTSKVIQSFFSMMNIDVWLTVRANNKVARSFYEKNGMSNVGPITWSNGKVKGRIYKISKPTDKYGIWDLTPVNPFRYFCGFRDLIKKRDR
jgi:hypothetical protein